MTGWKLGNSDFSVYIDESDHKFYIFEKLKFVNSSDVIGLFLHPYKTWENFWILMFSEVQKDQWH